MAAKKKVVEWVLDADGGVRAADEDALLCEADRLLGGKELSHACVESFPSLFSHALAQYGYVTDDDEMEHVLKGAARIHAYMLLAGEVAALDADEEKMRDPEVARVWLAGALIRVAGSLADRARAIALDENGVDYAAARWVVERCGGALCAGCGGYARVSVQGSDCGGAKEGR